MGRLPGLTKSKMEIISNDNDQYHSIYYLADYDDTEAMTISFAKSKGTVDSKQAVVDGETLGELRGYGYDGATFRRAAGIYFGVDGIPNIDDMPGKISFFTALDGTTTLLERMTMKNDGKLGIGTLTPDQLLTVSGNINVTSGYDVYDGLGNAYVTMEDLSGHLIDENDPIWTLDKPNYYTKLQIDNALAGLAG